MLPGSTCAAPEALPTGVPRPAVLPDPASWSVRLHRTVLTLPAPDAELVGRELAGRPRPYADAVDGYRATRRGA